MKWFKGMTRGWLKLTAGAGSAALLTLLGGNLEPVTMLPAGSHEFGSVPAHARPVSLATTPSPPPVESQKAPSPLWLVVMPAIPIVGGMFTYWRRRRLMSLPHVPRSAQSPLEGSPTPLRGAIAYFPLVGLAMVTTVSFGTYVFMRSRLIPPVLAQLEVLADSKEQELDAWFDQQRQAVLDAATVPETLLEIEQLLTQQNRQDEDFQAAYAAFGDYLATLEAFGDGNPAISLLTNGGIVVFATDTTREGQYQPLQNTTTYFTRDRLDQVPNLYLSPFTEQLQITFATPVLGPEEQRLGVLAVDLDLDDLDRQIDQIPRDRVEMGAIASTPSLQAYLVGRSSLVKNQIISAAADLRKQYPDGVTSRGITTALSRQEGAGLYLNYAKVPVIGVYRWASRHNLTLLVEVNQAEVFQPARRVARQILGLGFIATFLGTLGLMRLKTVSGSPLEASVQPHPGHPPTPDAPSNSPDRS